MTKRKCANTIKRLAKSLPIGKAGRAECVADEVTDATTQRIVVQPFVE